MKLSTRGIYGLMAMYRLSQSYGEGPISIKFIANSEELSEAYLEQLFIKLKKAGLIKSTRGPSGGYSLTRSPSDIKLREIINALEGDIGFPCCSKQGNCEKTAICPTKGILESVQNEIDKVLESKSLADMG